MKIICLNQVYMCMDKNRLTQNTLKSLINLGEPLVSHLKVLELLLNHLRSLETPVVISASKLDLVYTLYGSYFSNTMERLLEIKDSLQYSSVSLYC
jgi:hypothetical protein